MSEGTPKPIKDVQFNYLGKLLIHLACDNDSEEIIDFRIDNAISAKFNSNIDGVVMSPIHIACAHGNVKVMMKLLKSGICKTTDMDKSHDTIFVPMSRLALKWCGKSSA